MKNPNVDTIPTLFHPSLFFRFARYRGLDWHHSFGKISGLHIRVESRASPLKKIVKLGAFLGFAAAAFAWFEAEAHHPVGIPQYRDRNGTIVMIYNVLTQDYIVRLEVRPGRPVSRSSKPIEFFADIKPKDPAAVFSGGTYLSIVEDLGDKGEVEVLSPALKSNEPGARSAGISFAFDHPGNYVARVEFMESPGREVLSFPVAVSKADPSAGGWTLKLVIGGLVVVSLLVLTRFAALRQKRRASPPAQEGRNKS
jgi:hypothetical protein